MNTYQVERDEETITFTLLPFHSSALGQIKDHRFGISALHRPTVKVRVIAFQQQSPFFY
ncbi:hypothetical protein I8751_20165 [Nostocaceae cyanobacterium CENA357]|uniref:Uncharacterized protein n=1 Tax=Atlanticothrix silvestris CENA357 TaxID=1725252 RepID=A0A8J7L313_9CYAN|nr:hypothetical protein [Atlanticothrix silvestris]MBH8554630.1 hypothetical protein [Atlanticothrix silvestris CENA357]